MTKEEIEHLARLSRIRLSDTEVVSFQQEISSILEYVSMVQSMASVEVAPVAGEHRNIFRTDEVTNEPGSYTEVLLEAMPHKVGRFMAVKKIIQQDE